MNIESKTRISDIMTTHLVSSYPDMIMTEVSKLLDANSFHHLPVIDENDHCVGVISKSDYYQLQDSFTKMNHKQATKNNAMFFRSLLASEVMTPNPESLLQTASMNDAIKIFLNNRVHSIVVTDQDNKCVGIVTPFDILKSIYNRNYE